MTLPLIVDKGEIMATERLSADDLAIYYPNDDMRLDGHKTHVSCSVQYPNAWYLKAIEAREPLFRDWVVLLIRPEPLWWDDTLFCAVNAASSAGSFIGSGVAAFDSMFETFTPNARVGRGLTHLESCPTDNQAEVLVRHGIPIDLVDCVVVRDEAQADREKWRMKEFGLNPHLGIGVSGQFFDARSLAGSIASGVEVNPVCQPL